MLIDGRVRRGLPADLQQPIYSRVGVRDGEEVRPVLVGYEPRVGPGDAAEALAAAERALGGGMGEWPTASIVQSPDPSAIA
ncbi:MAG: hypothetical protein ACM31C_17480 [Acidobacteriota bacterium]